MFFEDTLADGIKEFLVCGIREYAPLVLLVENILQLIQCRVADSGSSVVIDTVAIQNRLVVIYVWHYLFECLACDIEKICYSAGAQGRDADVAISSIGIDDIAAKSLNIGR